MIKYLFFKLRWRTVIIMFLSIYAITYMFLNFGVDTLPTSIHNCPACYGNNICSQLEISSKLLFPSNIKLFNLFFNIKNVFYIERYNVKYVAKKLAHESELMQFDENLCKAAGFNLSCNESEAIKILSSMYGNKIADIVHGVPHLFDNIDSIKCNQQSTLDYMYSQFKKLDTSQYSLYHFITLLAINPEPLIIQAKFKDIPLPQIYGMCGRLFVETYNGKRLSQFYNADWMDRAYLSLQLLQIALDASENEWKLFLLDVSPNNFAVDTSMLVRLIDVENILILDSTVDGLSEKHYQNDGKGCLDCLSFVYEDLCAHKCNDHNYFAICKGLLAPSSFSNDMPNGLLHNMPKDSRLRYSSFEDILEECAYPNKMTRKEAALLLIDILKNVTGTKYHV